jgi:hypothetical protein
MKRFLLLTLLFFSIISVKISAQPNSVITLTGGYAFPAGDLQGQYGDSLSNYRNSADSNTYFMKYGISFGINIKISLIKNTKLKFIGGMHYTLFGHHKDFVSGDSVVKVYNNINYLSLLTGIEYSFLSKNSKINPFIGLSLMTNFINGSYEEKYYDSTKTVNLKSTIRFGFEANSGVDFVLSNRVGIIAGIKFNYINVLLRSYEKNTLHEYNLNDKEYTSGTFENKKKNMFSFILYAGFSLYLGI